MNLDEFRKKVCINTLLKNSDNEFLRANSDAINEFNLLDSERILSLKDPNSPENGYWLTNLVNVKSLLEYLDYNKSISKMNVVKEKFTMKNFNNVFEIYENRIKIFKTYGDSLIRIVINEFKNKKCLTNLDIYDNVSASLQIILESLKGRDRIPLFEKAWQYYDKDTKDMIKRVGINLDNIGNLKLEDLDFKTIDTIIKTIRKESDEKVNYKYNFFMHISRTNECSLMSGIASDVYKAMEEHFQYRKVKTK